MAKREALGLPRVPVAWDFAHYTRATEGQAPALSQGQQPVREDVEDAEERTDGQGKQEIGRAILDEFVMTDVAHNSQTGVPAIDDVSARVDTD